MTNESVSNATAEHVRISDGAFGQRVITLARPERRNALGAPMIRAITFALREAQRDAKVRSITLAGDGAMFCAGGDFSQMPVSANRSGSAGSGPDYADLLATLIKSEVPVIARVHGAAFGGGLGLVAASTFAICARSVSLGTPEVNVGLFPMTIMAVLERFVPRRRLVQMMLLGETFPAEVALELGIVSSVVAPEALDATVDSFAERVSTLSRSTLRLGLRAIADQDTMRLDAALPLLRDRLLEVIGTEDAQEGLAAFAEKRAPKWRGT